MNFSLLPIKKHSIRFLLAIGAALGIASCSTQKTATTTTDPNPTSPAVKSDSTKRDSIEIREKVYGPPPPFVRDPKPEKTVYGPPVPLPKNPELK